MREEFLIAPRGTASRPGALNNFLPCFISPWGDAGRMSACPPVVSCSCTPGSRSLELSLKVNFYPDFSGEDLSRFHVEMPTKHL